MSVATELKTKTPDQLTERLVELKKEQFNLRFQTLPASWKTPPGCVRCVARSRPSRRCSATAPRRRRF